MYWYTVVVQSSFWSTESRTSVAGVFFRNEVFVSARGNAEAMEPNAYPKAEYWGDDDSFTVEWRMNVLQDVQALKEHNVDTTSATINEMATKIVKQVSNWRLAGITSVRLEPRAAVLTPNTAATTRITRNTLNELSWDRAKPRSLARGMETYVVLKKLVIADDRQEWIEGIGHETVNENLNKAVMNDTNSDVNSGVKSEEPEFVWTVLCQTTTQKPVRKNDTNWTHRDSKDQECFSCVVVSVVMSNLQNETWFH